MTIKELLPISGWKILCRLIIDKTDLTVDPTKYGDTIARRIFAKFGGKPVNEQYTTYVEIEGDDAIAVISDDIAMTYNESWIRNYKALVEVEYNPIENYDRNEFTERHHSDDDTNTYGERTDTKGQQINTNDEYDITYGAQEISSDAYEDNHEHQKSGYNSNSYVPESKDIDNIDDKKTTNGEHKDTYGQTKLTEGLREDVKGIEEDTLHNEGEDSVDSHVHGNVGVTTNQQMILSEIDLRNRWRMVDIIVNDIVNEITLKCY